MMKQLAVEFEKAGSAWTDVYSKIISLGPRRSGPNVLLNTLPLMGFEKVPESWISVTDDRLVPSLADPTILDEVFGAVMTGFDLACQGGPLCDEPLIGVCYSIVGIQENTTIDQSTAGRFGPLSGQVISTIKDGCRVSASLQSQRLVEPVYKCDLEVGGDVLGKLYGLIGKRRGRILGEESLEGTELFSIRALLPVVESFGFGEELRKKTSGNATPQLFFSHWEVLLMDPSWIPTTEDEVEDFGDDGSAVVNVPRQLINAVRKRKGLMVDEKIVAHGEKQRTLQRKK